MKNKVSGVIVLCFLCAGIVHSQNLSTQDSGWVRIFNGENFDGLYSRMYGQEITRPPNSVFQIENAGTDSATIRVSGTGGGQQGHVGTDKTTYSHYRMRIEYRFDVANNGNNAGLTYHTDETVPRMNNNWPRSIECQMKQNETGSAFSIQQVAFTSRTNGTGAGSPYTPTGGSIIDACQFGCDGRWYRGSPLVGSHPAWNHMEVVVRGADSAIHIINGEVVFKLWDMRIADNNGNTIEPHDHGAFAVQSEGALIRYRRWEVMEFPENTPASEHFLHRYVLENLKQGETLKGDSTVEITWNTIGTIPTVTLEYHTGTGSWQTIAEDVANSGSYSWTVPNTPTEELRIRLSGGPSWAGADSSEGFNTINGATSIHRKWSGSPISFHVEGKGEIFKNIENFAEIEVRNASGKTVRHFVIGAKGLRWNLTDERGIKVGPGLYYLRLSGEKVSKTAQVLIF